MGTPPVEFARVGEHEIAYLLHNPRAGGVPLVFVHGFSMSVRFWELAMLPEIEADRRWVSVSLPFHFPSRYHGDAGEAKLTDGGLFACLDAAIRAAMGERPVQVIGHSVGGCAALLFAMEAPERCLGAMSIGGFADGHAMGPAEVLQWLALRPAVGRRLFATGWWLLRSTQASLRAGVLSYAADRAAVEAYPPFEPTLELLLPDVRAHDPDELFVVVRWMADTDIRDRLVKVRVPVWVLAGESDPVVDFGPQAQVAEGIVDAKLHTFPGAGHLLFAERTEGFNTLLLRFVSASAKT